MSRMAGKTYTFNVIIEPDEDRWFAHCPALEECGAATWGYTREEALRNIDEVVNIIVDELREDGIETPAGATNKEEALSDARIAVTV